MLYISYGSVCELETQILLAGDLDLIEKVELSAKKRHSRNRKNVKDTHKIFRKQTLESLDPLLRLNWRRTLFYYYWEKDIVCIFFLGSNWVRNGLPDANY